MFSAIFVAFAICVHLPVIGLDNEEASPDRIFGWLMYWTIESFGSVAIPMLWYPLACRHHNTQMGSNLYYLFHILVQRSVATSLVLPRHGKDVFAVITLCNQLGASSGSSIALAAPYIGFSGLFLVGVGIKERRAGCSCMTSYVSGRNNDVGCSITVECVQSPRCNRRSR